MLVAESWYLYKEHYSGFWFTILRKDSPPPCGVLLRRRVGTGVGRPNGLLMFISYLNPAIEMAGYNVDSWLRHWF